VFLIQDQEIDMTARITKVAVDGLDTYFRIDAPAVAGGLTRTNGQISEALMQRLIAAFAPTLCAYDVARNETNGKWYLKVSQFAMAETSVPTRKPASQRAAEKAEATVFDNDTSVAGTHTCGRCAGTGLYIIRIENDKPVSRGSCYRCKGKGVTSDIDRRRNLSYDEHSAGKLTA
jgi:hypothetical protein